MKIEGDCEIGNAARGEESAARELAPRLRRSKLDLLPILHELIRSRSLTRTGRALGMSQPAVSKALRQLRAEFGDELIVSLGRSPRLTDRAEALAEPLHRALSEIDALLRPETPFDPATETAVFTITTADYASALLAPLLVEMCAAEAPGVVLEFVDTAFSGVEGLAKVDVFIPPRAFRESLGKRVGWMPLWRDEVVCIASVGNSNIGERVTAASFRRQRQVGYQTSSRVPPHVRTQLLPTAGLETARVATVPDFLLLAAMVERSDCVALLPRRLAVDLCRSRALRIVDLDYPDRHFEIDACWSLAATGKRGHAWLRDLLGRAAARLD